MRAVIQRVKSASVKVDSKQIGKIERGLLIFVGVGKCDTDKDADYVASKIMDLMNLSLKDVNGQMLIVSQFTLFGDCRKGKRPSFDSAADIEKAKYLYEFFIERCKQSNLFICNGMFRENMLVDLINDGPVTILLDSKKVF